MTRAVPRTLFICALLLAISGCSKLKYKVRDFFPIDDKTVNEPAPIFKLQQRLSIESLWSHRIGRGTRKKFYKLVPAAKDGVIFIADHNGKVSAVDAETGDQKWRQNLKTAITGGPGVGDNSILVGTLEGELIALDPESGEPMWRATLSSEILSAPSAADGIAVVRTGDGKLFGLKETTGQRMWAYERSMPVLTLRGTSAPVIADDVVLAGFDSGRLVALDLKTGRLVWETRVAVPSGRSDLERMVDIDAQPIVSSNLIFIATFQGPVAAVSLYTGDIEWNRKISSHTGLTVDSQHVYLVDEESRLWALDRDSGRNVWRQDNMRYRAVTAPLNTGGILAIGDQEGYVHWIRGSDGKIVQRTRGGKKPIIATPILVNGDLVVTYGASGVLSAFRIGEEIEPEPEPEPEKEPEKNEK